MDHRPLGGTGIHVSRLILGCGNFGGVGSAPAFFGHGDSQAQARALMDAAWDAGITVFDTADAYGGGRSESFIGRWLADKGPHVREGLILSSKVFHSVTGNPADRGLSRARILRQVEGSLARLGTDRLDLYLIHEPDPQTPLEETVGALDELVRAGKVRAVGASNIEAWRLHDALAISDARRLCRFEWVQSSYSLLDRAVEAEVLPLCAERGLGFTAFSPLAGGWLTGKYREGDAPPAGSRMTQRPEPYQHLWQPQVFAGLAALSLEARARGVPMSTLALAWSLGHPHMTGVVIGPRTPAHLADAVAALDLRLAEADRAHLARTLIP